VKREVLLQMVLVLEFDQVWSERVMAREWLQMEMAFEFDLV
jgi:hypothetical protein